MKKTPIKTYPHQHHLEVFQIGSLCESKMIFKNQESKLKKIGRNKFVLKQISLPAIISIKNKQTEQLSNQPQCKGKENQLAKGSSSKYLSLVKNRQINIEQRLERRAITQNIMDDRLEAQKMKGIIQKRNYLMKNRKLLPLRNCMSAISVQIKQEYASLQPKQFRRNLLKKNSSHIQNQNQKQRPLHIQANKIAKQARAVSAPRLNRSNYKTCALQDFLNDWKDKNL